MKAWPIDPLDFRNLKLEVSEKLPLIVAALKPGSATEASRRLHLAVGDTPKLRGTPKAEATKSSESIGRWLCRYHRYGDKAFGCNNGQSAAEPRHAERDGEGSETRWVWVPRKRGLRYSPPPWKREPRSKSSEKGPKARSDSSLLPSTLR